MRCSAAAAAPADLSSALPALHACVCEEDTHSGLTLACAEKKAPGSHSLTEQQHVRTHKHTYTHKHTHTPVAVLLATLA